MKVHFTAWHAMLAALLCVPALVVAENPTDWTGFEYSEGRHHNPWAVKGTFPIYYQLEKDYTVSLRGYFSVPSKLPDSSQGDARFYRDHATTRPAFDGDFLRIEKTGILTIKKGYRWDGATVPCRQGRAGKPYCHSKYHHLRSSLVHDALYDAMRLTHLVPDTHHDNLCIDDHTYGNEGDDNRRMADMIIALIMMEDGLDPDKAQTQYDIIRFGGACRTTNTDDWLPGWNFHVSELTARGMSSSTELEWKRADAAGRDPHYDDHFSAIGGYRVMRDGEQVGYVQYKDDGNYKFLDQKNVQFGEEYHYQILPMWGMPDFDTNSNVDDWSNVDTAVPFGFRSGNALRLGLDPVVEQYVDVPNTIMQDLSFHADLEEPVIRPFRVTAEAWVYPMAGQSDAHIFSFELMGDENNEGQHLMYCGDAQTFCFRQDDWPEQGSFIGYAPVSFEPNKWYHVALTLYGAGSFPPKAVLFVNGVEMETFYPPNSTSISRDASVRIGGGLRGGGPGRFFKGYIDEARIWNTARTADQLTSGMCKPSWGNEDGLAGLWHFDNPDDSGPTICDPDADRMEPGCITYDDTANANHALVSYNTKPFVRSGAMIPVEFSQDIVAELDRRGTVRLTGKELIPGFADNACMKSVTTNPAVLTCNDIGQNMVRVDATDINGDHWTALPYVTVEDNSPPKAAAALAIPGAIRSVDNRMVRVSIDASRVSDNCGITVSESCGIEKITATEPLVKTGPDKDYEIIDDLTVNLRAISSQGQTRSYFVEFACTDANFNSSSKSIEVAVIKPKVKDRNSGALSTWSVGLLVLVAAYAHRRRHVGAA